MSRARCAAWLALALLVCVVAGSCTGSDDPPHPSPAKSDAAACQRLALAVDGLRSVPAEAELTGRAGTCRLVAGDRRIDVTEIPSTSLQLTDAGDRATELQAPISGRWSTRGVASGGTLWLAKGDQAYRIDVSLPSAPEKERAVAVAIGRRLVRSAGSKEPGTTGPSVTTARSSCPENVLAAVDEAVGEIEEVATQDEEACTFWTDSSVLVTVRLAACEDVPSDVDEQGELTPWRQLALKPGARKGTFYASTLGSGARRCITGPPAWQVDASGGGAAVQADVAEAIGMVLPIDR